MTKLTQDEMKEIVRVWAKDIRYEKARRRARTLKRKGLTHEQIRSDIVAEHGEEIALLIDMIKNNGYYHYKNLERV